MVFTLRDVSVATGLCWMLLGCDSSSSISADASGGGMPTSQDLALTVATSPAKTLNFSWTDVGADDYLVCRDVNSSCEQIAVITPAAALSAKARSLALSSHQTLTYTYYLETLINPSDDDVFYIRARIDDEAVDSETYEIVYKEFKTIIGSYTPRLPATFQNHGHVVSVSGDGMTKAISTLVSGDANVNGGEVTVYRRGDNGWQQIALLTSPYTNADPFTGFGFDVDINNDGSVIVIGAWKQSVSGITEAGAAYVYTESAQGSWTNYAVIENPTPTAKDFFASSVSLSGAGDALVIGAYNEDSSGTSVSDQLPADDAATNSGMAFLYQYNQGTDSWDFTWSFKASNADNFDFFGKKVRLSRDGNVLLATAGGEDSYTGDPNDDSVPSVGAAYVYRKQPDNSWLEEAYLKSTLPIKLSSFGESAAISHGGDIIAIGVSRESTVASTDNTGMTLLGAVHVWQYDGASWNHQARLTGSNAEDGDAFGTSVTIGNNGKWLAVGAQYEDSNDAGINAIESNNDLLNAGAAYIFELNGSWQQTHYLKSPRPSEKGFFGRSIAFSSIEKELAISATGELVDDGGSEVNAGVVYLF